MSLDNRDDKAANIRNGPLLPSAANADRLRTNTTVMCRTKFYCRQFTVWTRELLRKCYCLAVTRNRYNKRHDAPTQLGVFESRESLRECHPVRAGEEVRYKGRRGRITIRLRLAGDVRRTLEKESHGHLENVRDMLQAARADAIPSFLVFLDLLERDSESKAKFLLSHAEHESSHSHAASDVLVDWVRDLGHLARVEGLIQISQSFAHHLNRCIREKTKSLFDAPKLGICMDLMKLALIFPKSTNACEGETDVCFVPLSYPHGDHTPDYPCEVVTRQV